MKRTLIIFLVVMGVSCSGNKMPEPDSVKENLGVETISKAKQVFILDTLLLSNIIVVENLDSLHWFDKYILFYDSHNKLVDCVFTETAIDSVVDGCVYFTEPILQQNRRANNYWPNNIPRKIIPYHHQTVTTEDCGIVTDYYFTDSSIVFIFNHLDKPLLRNDIERMSTFNYIDTNDVIKDTLSSSVSNIIFDYSSIELTPDERLKRLRYRTVTIKSRPVNWRLTIHEDIEAGFNEDMLFWLLYSHKTSIE